LIRFKKRVEIGKKYFLSSKTSKKSLLMLKKYEIMEII
jgi:hypothetical protein